MYPLKKSFLPTTCCALMFSFPAAVCAQSSSQAASTPQQIAASTLPDSPGTSWANEKDASEQSSSSQTTAASQSSSQQPEQDPNQKIQRPVGTAAAEAPKTKGVTAAQPSGVAIAPAKQRRVRTIIIKYGAMVAAAAAVGTVIALTEATPSKPPGAH